MLKNKNHRGFFLDKMLTLGGEPLRKLELWNCQKI